MDAASPRQDSDWKLFLQLGEELLAAADSASQGRVICDFLLHHLHAKAEVWFVRPAYPLPGEGAALRLLNDRSPKLVRQAFAKSDVQSETAKNGKFFRIALPLISQESYLAVLLVERPGESPFTDADHSILAGITAHSALAMQTTRQIRLKNWRYDQLSLVRTVSQRIANQRDLSLLCRQVVELIRQTFDLYFVSIFTLDGATDTLHFQASSGPSDEEQDNWGGFSIQSGEGIVGTAAKMGREMIVPDISLEPLYRSNTMLPDTRAEVAIPLKVENIVLGVLDVQNDEARALHEFDLSILRTLADSIALAVESTQVFTRLGLRTTQLSAVLEISHAVTSTLDFDDLLDVVVKSIRKHFDYDYIHIYSVNQGRRKIFYEAGLGGRAKGFAEFEVTFNLDAPDGIIPWVAREGKTYLANDVSTVPIYRPPFLRPETTRAELAIPLVYVGEVLGVLDLQSERLNGFDVNDVPLLEALASAIAIGFRNAKLYQSETWRRQVADSFREIAGLVSANVALEDLLNRILLLLDQNLPGKASAIWLLEEDYTRGNSGQQNLHLAAARGVDVSRLQKIVEQDSASRDLIENIIQQESPFIRGPHDLMGPVGKAMGYQPDYSSISAPLRAGDQSLGVLILVHPDPGCYGEESSLISMTLASNAAVAIQNARLFTAAQEQAWISTILFKVAEAAQNSESTNQLLETMARLTPLLTGIKKCAFFTWDEDQFSFHMKSHYGLETPGIEDLSFSADVPAIQRLLSTHSPVFIEDPVRELNLQGMELPRSDSTVVILPLMSRGKLLGAFLVGHQNEPTSHGPAAFDQQTLSLLLGIGQQTAVGIENLVLLEARQEEAYVTAVLLQVAQAVVSQNTLEDTLDSIVHLMPILVGIDACAIYLWNTLRNEFIVARAFSGNPRADAELESQPYTAGQFPLLDAARERDELIASKVTDPRLSIAEWPVLTRLIPGDELNEQFEPGTNWVLGVPLSVKGEVYGVMAAAEANSPASFHSRRQDIINGIAQQVSLAIQNDRLNREMVERERLEKEMQLARQIQRTFLPSKLPRIAGWDLDIVWQTARQVGGDFYDIFKLGRDKLGIVIADVSDKGMPAALYMTVARTLIRAFVHEIPSPARVLERVNRLLVVDSQDGLFVTAVYAVLDLLEGKLIYANAGHNLPLLVHNQSDEIEKLPKGGMALGVKGSTKYQEHTLEICPGDLLLMYTDGVTESISADSNFFGEDGLIQALKDAPRENAGQVIEFLSQRIVSFRSGAPASDDLTLVAINRPLFAEE